MVRPYVYVVLAAAVLASVCLAPLTVHGDSMLGDSRNADESPTLFDLSLNASLLNNPFLDRSGPIGGGIVDPPRLATEFQAVASEPEVLELIGICLVIIFWVLRRRAAKKAQSFEYRQPTH